MCTGNISSSQTSSLPHSLSPPLSSLQAQQPQLHSCAALCRHLWSVWLCLCQPVQENGRAGLGVEHCSVCQLVCCSVLPGLESCQLCCLVPPEYTGQWPHPLLLACEHVNAFLPRLYHSLPSSSSCWYGYWWAFLSTSWEVLWGRTLPQGLMPRVGLRTLLGRSHHHHGIAVWWYTWQLEDSYHSGECVWFT